MRYLCWSGAFAISLAVVLLSFVLEAPVAKASQANAFTSAGTSISAEVRHPASGASSAFPEAAHAVAGGASGYATARAFGLEIEDVFPQKPSLSVSAASGAGGDEDEIAGFASASASWTDRLRFDDPLIEPPANFLELKAVFQFHVEGSIYGAPGAASCGYLITIDRTNAIGDHVQYKISDSVARPAKINRTLKLPVSVDIFIPGLADGTTNMVYPVFTLGFNASARSLYEPSEESKYAGDGEADFENTFALDTIYFADEHGNPVSGFENIKIVGDNGAYVMGPPKGGFLNEMVVLDRFGRRVNEHGITLVDWEGEIANPAIQLKIVPPSDTTFPATAVISCPGPRVYFDEPSTTGLSGSTKTLTFTNNTPLPLLVSIFPDRDGTDEDWPMTVDFSSANGATRTLYFNAHVIDQDQPARPVDFPVTLDFSQDQTGFFMDEATRALYQQLANDWAYFFADPGLDTVPAGAEKTFIWNPTGFIDGSFVTNANAYRGYLLYAYGIDEETPPYRSGGEPSNAGGFLTAGGTNLNLRRSGGQELEVKGNYNTLGWNFTGNLADDDDWWMATNLGDTPNDLASIPHHEMGHAFIFNPAQPAFANFKTLGSVKDARVLAYQGAYPAIDASDHLAGSVDRVSGKGAFGYEYYGTVPARRWLITKLDLLVAQAIGYPLRETSPFVPAAIATNALPRGGVGGSYAQTLQARGGIPFYRWSISSGTLPPGLALDSFTGAITGVPTTVGTYGFVVQLEDYDEVAAAVEAPFSIRIEATPFEITNVQRTPTATQVSYRTAANHTYRVEYSADLQSWTTLISGVAGTGEVVTASDPIDSAQSKRFYRVVEL
jgi:hypothetical protein